MFHHCSLRCRWTFSILLASQLAHHAFGQVNADEASPRQPSLASLELTAGETSSLAQAISTHDYQAAEKLLLAAIDRDPHSRHAAKLLAYAGTVYFLSSDYLNAAVAWKKSEAIAALDPSLQFSLAMAYVRMGHAYWARPVLQTLEKEQPTNVLYPYWLGRLDYDAQHYNEAIEHFKRALVLSPAMARAYDNLGLCYFYENNNTLAVESYKKAIELDRTSPHPSAWPHLNLAIALQFLNRLDPQFAQAHFQLGSVLEDLGRATDAIPELRESARLDPNYAEPHFALARIFHKLGRESDAQVEVQMYRRLRTNNNPAPKTQAH
jgi:tetratricopeptide (TPR) repeat protein